LERLEGIRRAWLRIADGSPTSELAWLALCGILRECSPVGTAQWKYEAQIRYNNDDKVNAEFHDKATTLDFLKSFESGNCTPAEGEDDTSEDVA